MTRTQVTCTGFLVDGHTRKIPDFLMKAGQGIKKRTFTAVRISYEANMYLTFVQ
jgi:hypothetical protein